MQLAGPYAFGAPPDRTAAIGVLQAAVAAGVDHIDTAQYYGPGIVNDLIREALYPYPDGLAIVSKVAVRRDDSGAVLPFDDPHQLREGIEDNLRSLRVGQLSAVNLLFHLADRHAAPLLAECLSRGIAFVPFCPLGWPRGQDNPVLTRPVVTQTAARLGVTPAQVALQWLLQLAPNVLLIPGTGSIAHLRENLAAEGVTLDDQTLRQLDGVGA
jgi:aryl-alcohol dehydrogenase-like predicted oxidoreductase